MLEKINFDPEIDSTVEQLTNDFIHKHTCQIIIKKDGKFLPHASGVLVKTNTSKYLLTAAHVTENIDSGILFIQIGTNKFSIIAGDLLETDLEKSKIDICIIRLSKVFTKTLPDSYVFLPISKFRDHKKTIEATQYCVMGYPEKSILKSEIGKGYIAQAFYLKAAKEKVYNYYDFDKDSFIILEMSGKGKNIKTGQIEKNDKHLYGLSGCGLWLLMIKKENDSYSIDYRLIGIMSEFRNSKYFVLIGIKIIHVISGLYQFGETHITKKNS